MLISNLVSRCLSRLCLASPACGFRHCSSAPAARCCGALTPDLSRVRLGAHGLRLQALQQRAGRRAAAAP